MAHRRQGAQVLVAKGASNDIPWCPDPEAGLDTALCLSTQSIAVQLGT